MVLSCPIPIPTLTSKPNAPQAADDTCAHTNVGRMPLIAEDNGLGFPVPLPTRWRHDWTPRTTWRWWISSG